MRTSRHIRFRSWGSKKDSITNSSCNCMFNYWQRLRRPVLALLLSAVVAIGSGCTAVNTLKMKDAFPDSGFMAPGRPAVTVLPVRESPAPGPYAADRTYLGKGLAALIGLGPFFIPPVVIISNEFRADGARTDIVRMAVLSRLKHYGVPADYQAVDGVNDLKSVPKTNLGLSVRLRTFDVDTTDILISETLFVSAIAFSGIVSHVVLDCQLMQQGQVSPLWQGVGEGRYDTSDFNKQQKEDAQKSKDAGKDPTAKVICHNDAKCAFDNVWPIVVNEAVSVAVDQCLTKSGLLGPRAKGTNQREAIRIQR